MDLGLRHKLVLVTGSGSGIGKATAQVYVEEGARVIVHGLTDDEVAACLADLSGMGDVTGAAGDLTSAAEANALCAFVQGQGEVDILVNNVGIFSVKPFEDLTDADWPDPGLFVDGNQSTGHEGSIGSPRGGLVAQPHGPAGYRFGQALGA